MPVIGMIIKTIDAKKHVDQPTGNIKVNNNTNFKEVKEEDIKALGKKGLTIGFEFKSEYVAEGTTKSVADIIIGGDVIFLDAEQHDKIVKEWKKDRKIPEAVNLEIVNSVLRRCIIKALALSEELQLPPPIMLPFATNKKQEDSSTSRYIG